MQVRRRKLDYAATIGSSAMFWYVSRHKLEALSAEGAWWDRLSGAKVGVWPASVEVGMHPGDEPKLERAVRRVNKRLRKENAVVHVKDLEGRGPVRFFEYEGPSVRNVAHGGLFVAAICNPFAIVLVGSAVNAIGAPLAQDVLVGSGDPMGAVRHLLRVHGHQAAIEEIEHVHLPTMVGVEDDPTEVYETSWFEEADDPDLGVIEMAWLNLFREVNFSEVESLPRTRGVALYAGSQEMHVPAPETSRIGRVDHVLLGSPVWVEQVEA